MANLSNDQISILHHWNNSIRSAHFIHHETKIPLSTVKYNIKKLKETKSLEHRGGNGRPCVINNADSRAIAQYIRRDNETTLKEIQEKLSETHQRSVSLSTISRYLHNHGYRSVLPVNTPMLTVEQKQRRVQWAKKHQADDWTCTIFTDESSFQLFRNTIRRWSKNPEIEVKRIPKNRQKVHIWGAISIKGVIGYHTFRINLNGIYFVDILKHHLLPGAKMKFKRCWRLQQDNDPKHTSGVAKEFIKNNVPELLEWPANSPDLNPIENYWNVIKRRVEKRKPTNINDMEQFMNEEIEKTDPNFLINFINSMKDRCLSVISSNGERIKF
ncbi:unnamed protein product [Adineta ricciae]|uniref:Transposase n=1 Tax=Adineta ricciae TaxID=249248 RepID=A0A816BN76_ADIRI|nr:unnamed protein product [Adineta ricciae]CAF1612702.1 unnamed protein product [Adineta ricciae]